MVPALSANHRSGDRSSPEVFIDRPHRIFWIGTRPIDIRNGILPSRGMQPHANVAPNGSIVRRNTRERGADRCFRFFAMWRRRSRGDRSSRRLASFGAVCHASIVGHCWPADFTIQRSIGVPDNPQRTLREASRGARKRRTGCTVTFWMAGLQRIRHHLSHPDGRARRMEP